MIRLQTRALRECRPPPRQICSGSGLEIWTSDDLQNLMGTSLSKVTFVIKCSRRSDHFVQRYEPNCGNMLDLAVLKNPLKNTWIVRASHLKGIQSARVCFCVCIGTVRGRALYQQILRLVSRHRTVADDIVQADPWVSGVVSALSATCYHYWIWRWHSRRTARGRLRGLNVCSSSGGAVADPELFWGGSFSCPKSDDLFFSHHSLTGLPFLVPKISRPFSTHHMLRGGVRFLAQNPQKTHQIQPLPTTIASKKFLCLWGGSSEPNESPWIRPSGGGGGGGAVVCVG